MNELPSVDHGRPSKPNLARQWAHRAALVAVPLVLLLLAGVLSPAAARPDAGVIAYVDDVTLDEIRLIGPDGDNNRLLWEHGVPDANNIFNIWNLAWKPDGSELAFASSHEGWCSINRGDIFAINAAGANYRRVTESPACDALAAYPGGTVEVPVENNTIFAQSGFVYFQGAPTLMPVNLPPFSSITLTFTDVADFGANFMQVATVIVGDNRSPDIATAVDVVAGDTVTAAALDFFHPDIYWQVYSPTWRSDGGRIGYVITFNGLRSIIPDPSPLDFGDPLQTDQQAMPTFVDSVAWGPASQADKLLYVGNEIGVSEAVYLLTAGDASAGQPLVTLAYYENIRGVAWLPDGSGFIYSAEESESLSPVRANIYEYSFSTRSSRQITTFESTFAGQLSVSPDGSQIVFERSAAPDYSLATDLWLVNRDGSGLELLVEDGQAPAWGPQGEPPPPGTERIYLPVTIR